MCVGPLLRRSATRNAELEENTTLSQSYEVDDSIQGPILRRSAVRREKNENSGSLSLTTMLQSEDFDKESGDTFLDVMLGKLSFKQGQSNCVPRFSKVFKLYVWMASMLFSYQ